MTEGTELQGNVQDPATEIDYWIIAYRYRGSPRWYSVASIETSKEKLLEAFSCYSGGIEEYRYVKITLPMAEKEDK